MCILVPFHFLFLFFFYTALFLLLLMSIICLDISIIFATSGLFIPGSLFSAFPHSLFLPRSLPKSILGSSSFLCQLERSRQSFSLVDSGSRDIGGVPPHGADLCNPHVPPTERCVLGSGGQTAQRNDPRTGNDKTWALILVPRVPHYTTSHLWASVYSSTM